MQFSADGWKWICGILAGLLVGVLTGEFLPNRQIATTDDLQKQITPLTAEIAAQTIEVAALRDELNDMKAQLRAQKLYSVP